MALYLKFGQNIPTFVQVWILLVPFCFECFIEPCSLFQRHGESAKSTTLSNIIR